MRILVVDDEVRLAETIARGLRAEGFEVDVANDGATGLWRARETPYAAIVLDLLMPVLNGYEVCRSLREEGVTTPVLILTAKTGEWDEVDSLETGADDFLSKPFSYAVLVARIRALIRRHDQRRSDTLECRDVTFDLLQRNCTRAGETVPLTPREASVLVAFLRSSGRVITKEALLSEVWGPDFDGSPNVVDVYVGYLRKKLRDGADDSTPLIETVRGVGFRMQCR